VVRQAIEGGLLDLAHFLQLLHQSRPVQLQIIALALEGGDSLSLLAQSILQGGDLDFESDPGLLGLRHLLGETVAELRHRRLADPTLGPRHRPKRLGPAGKRRKHDRTVRRPRITRGVGSARDRAEAFSGDEVEGRVQLRPRRDDGRWLVRGRAPGVSEGVQASVQTFRRYQVQGGSLAKFEIVSLPPQQGHGVLADGFDRSAGRLEYGPGQAWRD
jgi:hypothetical protein